MTEEIRAVIYGAKSTADKNASIPEQLDDCRQMARENGWTVIGEFVDKNFTAYTGNRGPSLAAAIKLAKETATPDSWVMLVAQHTSRFARGDGAKPGAPKALVELYHEWARTNVRGRLVENDQAMSNSSAAAAQGDADHNESKRKSTSVKKGLRRRARDRGLHNGGPRPYGFRYRDMTPEGQSTGPLIVYEPEAAIVRRIYAEYLAGRGQRQIARDLNDSITAQRGGTWHQGTISNMLAKPLYKGAIVLNGEVYEGQHEAIIDPETWDKARQLREALARSDGRGRARHPTGSHLFTKGLLRCGRCGEALIPVTKPTRTPGRVYEVYACYGRIRHGMEHCCQKPVRREAIDMPVWRFFEKVALDVDATRTAIVTAHSTKFSELDVLQAQVDRDAARVEQALNKIERDYLYGNLPAAEWQTLTAKLRDDLEAVQAQSEQLRKQRSAIEADIAEIDIESAVLAELTTIRAQIAGEARDGAGTGTDGLRAAIRRLFHSFTLMPEWSPGQRLWPESPEGTEPWQGEEDGLRAAGQLLWPHVRSEVVDLHAADFPALKRVALDLSVNNVNPLVT